MIRRRVKQRIEYLRQQPEPVRFRAVALYTGISGLILTAAWLGILLPLQLALTNPETDTETPATENTEVAAEEQNAAVSGSRATQQSPTPIPLEPSSASGGTADLPQQDGGLTGPTSQPPETDETAPVQVTQ